MKSMYKNNSIHELCLPVTLKDNDNVKTEAENINTTRTTVSMDEIKFDYGYKFSALIWIEHFAHHNPFVILTNLLHN